jgi:hypothetical protein
MLGVTLLGNQLKVNLDRHRLPLEPQIVQQLGNGCVVANLAGLTVNGELHIPLD